MGEWVRRRCLLSPGIVLSLLLRWWELIKSKRKQGWLYESVVLCVHQSVVLCACIYVCMTYSIYRSVGWILAFSIYVLLHTN